MKWSASRWFLLLTALAVVIGLPLARKWLTAEAAPRCAMDGLVIEPLYRIRIVDDVDVSRSFCCVRCAERWLSRQTSTTTTSVYVVDEATGAEIDHREGHFVRSSVITNRINANRIHVFQSRMAAEEHLRVFGGAFLLGAERPFALPR